MSDFEAALRALPKAELHVHLDGSVRPETLLDLAHAQRRASPGADAHEVIDTVRAGKVFRDLDDYLASFTHTIEAMQTPPALRRIAHELVEDAARENVHHLEIRFCPDLHTKGGLNTDQVLDAVQAGVEEGRRRFDVSVGVIVTALRNRSAEDSKRLAELAVEWKNRGVLGFDLAGSEHEHPASIHREACTVALSAGLGVTIHAGEVSGPESIVDALDCGATRIGHGTHLRDDPELLEGFSNNGIPLEMCPTSNVQTKSVSSYADHPALDYQRRGIPVVVNTDSRLISLTTVTTELMHLHTDHALTWSEAIQLCENGFRHAFLPNEARDELVGRVALVAKKMAAEGFEESAISEP